MKALIIIPARYQSSRFPGKPLELLGDKPVIQHVYERVTAVHPSTDVLVATDDQRIYDKATSFGAAVVMTSVSCLNGTERCAEAFSKLPNKSDYQVVINVQGDEPFLLPEHIANLLELMRTTKFEVGTLAYQLTNTEEVLSPHIVKVVIAANTKQALYFSRSPIPYPRDADKATYFRHIGIYAFRADLIGKLAKLEASPLELAESLEQLRWMENGYQIGVAHCLNGSIGIDTPEDLERANAILHAV